MQQGAFGGRGGAAGEVQQGRCNRGRAREVQQRTCSMGGAARGGATEEVQQRTCSRGRAAGKEEEEEGHARVNHKTTHRGSGNNMLLEDRAPLAIKCRWLR